MRPYGVRKTTDERGPVLHVQSQTRFAPIDAAREARAPHGAIVLLSRILHQARVDGMHHVRLQVRDAPMSVTLEYGRADQNGAVHWWTMTAPPAALYGAILRAAIVAATFDAQRPDRALIRCVFDQEPCDVTFECESLSRAVFSYCATLA
ncbi:hypothetical protein RAS1_14670 [Phycisphaerae bacterium RAS1]|nr:hypothetical protein RAS1_14670 [Phycisphaerae bacterium RAS1]